MTATRTGIGFDSHVFSGAGTLMLGGVAFPGVPALQGHSDGDALIHAVVDALLGAAGAGDIGQLFPDTSAQFKGIASLKMLAVALDRVRSAGFAPTHVDVVVVADRPKLAPSREKISAAIAQVLGLKPADVSVKGKTQEGLSWFSGSVGGIAVWATVNIEAKK
jgi:2-C-methyl-D-erythritol 2,4-cyclodiphosphate synthase